MNGVIKKGISHKVITQIMYNNFVAGSHHTLYWTSSEVYQLIATASLRGAS